MDAFLPSHSDELFANATEALDITMHRTKFAINSESYDGRSSCQGYGACMPVCTSGARYSADHMSGSLSRRARPSSTVPLSSGLNTERTDERSSRCGMPPRTGTNANSLRRRSYSWGAPSKFPGCDSSPGRHSILTGWRTPADSSDGTS